MSKLEKLIQQYCPDGVEYVRLGDVMSIQRGASPRPIQNYLTDDEYGIPWIKIGDVSIESKYITSTKERVTKEGAAKSRFLKKGSFILSNSMSFGRPYILEIDGCIHDGWISMCDFEKHLLPDFLYYLLRSSVVQDFWISKANSGGAVTNLNSDIVRSTLIPVPPLPVQEEVVRVLDTFTELQAELQAELQKRKQQYNFYRDNLLNFKDINRGGQEIKWMKLKDVATQWYRGAGIKREEVSNEGMPCIRYGEIHTSYNIWFKDCISHTDETKQATKKYAEYGDILFAITSEDIPLVGNSVAYLGKEKIMVGGDIVVMKHNQDPRYMAYALSTSDAIKQKGKGKVKSKVVHTNVPSLQEIVIPIPPMEEQQRIADILDRFDTLTNDLTSGLPAEMEKRRQQYEFYRDKLLTFKRKEA